MHSLKIVMATSGIQNRDLSHYMQAFGLFEKYCVDGLTVRE
jgi:hypothetical protein